MIKLDNINLAYQRTLIDNGSLIIPSGCVTGIVGKSGTGKTALLEVIGLLSDKSFNYIFDNINISKLDEEKKKDILRNNISFIFQDVHLLEDLTLKENIEFFASLTNKKISENEIHEQLEMMTLNVDIHTDVKTMSIGERQRLAILCGLLKDAKLFIFDEPTAYLDSYNREIVIDLILKLAKDMNKMVVIATHDQQLIENMDRIYTIEDSHLILKKDIEYQDDFLEVKEYKPFQIKSLYDYIKIKNKKKMYLQWILTFVIAIIMCLSVFSCIYSLQFKQESQNGLFDLLQHEFIITKGNRELITPKDYSILESKVGNPIYQFLELSGNVEIKDKRYSVKIFPYWEFEQLGNYLLEEDYNSDYYFSYPLYRKVESFDEDFSLKFQKSVIDSQTFNVLKPQYIDDLAVYVPYSEYSKILKENDIDIYNLSVEFCKIELKNYQDIERVASIVRDQYIIVSPYSIESRMQVMNLFNPVYMVILDVIVMILYGIFQIYQCIQNKNEIALLKTQGIRNKELLMMKVYETCQMMIKILLICCVCVVIMMFFISLNYIIFILCLFVLHIIVFYMMTLLPFYIILKKYSASILLRK